MAFSILFVFAIFAACNLHVSSISSFSGFMQMSTLPLSCTEYKYESVENGLLKTTTIYSFEDSSKYKEIIYMEEVNDSGNTYAVIDPDGNRNGVIITFEEHGSISKSNATNEYTKYSAIYCATKDKILSEEAEAELKKVCNEKGLKSVDYSNCV